MLFVVVILFFVKKRFMIYLWSVIRVLDLLIIVGMHGRACLFCLFPFFFSFCVCMFLRIVRSSSLSPFLCFMLFVCLFVFYGKEFLFVHSLTVMQKCSCFLVVVCVLNLVCAGRKAIGASLFGRTVRRTLFFRTSRFLFPSKFQQRFTIAGLHFPSTPTSTNVQFLTSEVLDQ